MIYVMVMYLKLCVGPTCEDVAVYDTPYVSKEMCLTWAERERKRLEKYGAKPICKPVDLR
jgi:hypothetical protein